MTFLPKKESITKIQEILNKLSEIKVNKILKYCQTLDLIEHNTNNKLRNSYNQRLYKDVLWQYMTKDIIINHKKLIEDTMKNSYYNSLYRSRFNNIKIFKYYDSIEIFIKNHNKVVMADYLMFNQFYILEYDLVDRLLPYCKIKIIDDYKYKIDGWIFEQQIYAIPNYKISYDDNDYDTMKFISTEEEKRLAVRLLIQVMNETPEEYVNFNNYNVISEWYYNNDRYINCYQNNIYFSNMNYKNKDFEFNLISNNDLILNLEDKFSKEEIKNMLENNAKYTNNDIKNLDISDIKSDIVFDIDNINTKTLDLTDFYKNNGYIRTKNIIDDINSKSKYRINCDNFIKQNNEKISKVELLAMLYNSSLPFGMGIFEYNNNTMKLDEANDLLKNNNYFDYLKGRPIKTDFNFFPIINYKRFDEYNGTGKFMECIKKLQSNKDIINL